MNYPDSVRFLYALGNESYGTYGSPYLDTVYEGDGIQRHSWGGKPPTCTLACRP